MALQAVARTNGSHRAVEQGTFLASSPRMELSTHEIEQRVRALGQWFHNIDLRGVKTAPDHFLGDYPNIKWRNFAHAVPADLTGKSVLDVGCNARSEEHT